MRAVTYDHTGSSSVLTVTEREKREPGNGEVRVKVVVSGVNPTDWKSREGAGAASGPFDDRRFRTRMARASLTRSARA
jgi:NADPH2:quinone reductase